MHAFQKITLVAALAAAGACGSDNPAAPDLNTELDPVVVQQRIDDVAAITEHPALASFLQLGNGVALTQVSRTYDRTAGIVSRTRRALRSGGTAHQTVLARRSSASATVGSYVPLEGRGVTYVWDEFDGWIPTEQTGAPSDGVRFIIPALDDAGQPTEQEIGRLDVHDLSTATTDRITATLVSGGKTLLTIDDKYVETETSYDNTTAVMVTDGVSRVSLAGVYKETWTGESDYRETETYEITTNVGLGYRSSYVWGDLRSSDVNWDQVTVGKATIRFSWKTELDPETGSYVESDDSEITVNGRLYGRVLYDPELGETSYENASGEPMTEAEVEQIYSGYVASEWLYETVYWPLYAVENATSWVSGGVILR